MELKIDMYVRTDQYGIAKIETIEEDRTEIYFNCDTGLSISFIKKDFTKEEMAKMYKHSYEITDLIEVGDYVNGLQVVEVREHLHNDKEIVLSNGEFNWSFSKNESDYEIKSILTKEQFKARCYNL